MTRGEETKWWYLTKALEVIQDECDKHFFCDNCPLRYKEDYGGYTCRLDNWSATSAMQPKDWPIDEVREMEHEG